MATSNGKAAQGEEGKTPPPAGSIGGYESLHRLLEANLSPELFQVYYPTTLSFPRWVGADSSHRAVARARFQIQLRTPARVNFFHMLNERCWITKLLPGRVLAADDRGKSGEFCVQFWCYGLA